MISHLVEHHTRKYTLKIFWVIQRGNGRQVLSFIGRILFFTISMLEVCLQNKNIKIYICIYLFTQLVL